MLRVIETFSGIGSQAKALKNAGIEHKIINTVEWDVYAICAYDLIHNGPRDISPYEHLTKAELIDLLEPLGLSTDGKVPADRSSLKVFSANALKHIYCAIRRTHNLVDITKVEGCRLPKRIDLLTYSFPCQDLSICGSWHGNMSGINRDAHNRSGMLWEIERVIKERHEAGMKLPKFLLMENVSNILSATHRENFQEWKDFLAKLGYENQVYTLNAMDFGIPQHRIRTYMLSVFCKHKKKRKKVRAYFEQHNLQHRVVRDLQPLQGFLRADYDNPVYKAEADASNPNDTPSRAKIYNDNEVVLSKSGSYAKSVNTLTTKQDRNPCSGVIDYPLAAPGKAKYRNLTPRECFMLMGFSEDDYDVVTNNDFAVNARRNFFAAEKLIKMAGNSIVVPVLEEIFMQADEIDKTILSEYRIYVKDKRKEK